MVKLNSLKKWAGIASLSLLSFFGGAFLYKSQVDNEIENLRLDNSVSENLLDFYKKQNEFYKELNESLRESKNNFRKKFLETKEENRLLEKNNKILDLKLEINSDEKSILEYRNDSLKQEIKICNLKQSVTKRKLENKKKILDEYRLFFEKGKSISGTLDDPKYSIQNLSGTVPSGIFSHFKDKRKYVSKGFSSLDSIVNKFSTMVDSVLSSDVNREYIERTIRTHKDIDNYIFGGRGSEIDQILSRDINGYDSEENLVINPKNYAKSLFEKITGDSWPDKLEISSDSLGPYLAGRYSLDEGIVIDSTLDDDFKISTILHEAGHAITYYPEFFDESSTRDNVAKKEALAYLFQMAGHYHAEDSLNSKALKGKNLEKFTRFFQANNASHIDSTKPHLYGIISANVILSQTGGFEESFEYMVNTDIDQWEEDFGISMDKVKDYKNYVQFSQNKIDARRDLIMNFYSSTSELEVYLKSNGYFEKNGK